MSNCVRVIQKPSCSTRTDDVLSAFKPANRCSIDLRSRAGFAEQGRNAPSDFVLMDRTLDFDDRSRNPRHVCDHHLMRLNIEWDRDAGGEFVRGRVATRVRVEIR